jgi:DNA-binding MarR family transcriptional regulator
VLRKLEHKGLVQRQPNKLDKRAFDIQPTRAGIRLVNRAIKEVEAVDRQYFEVLPKKSLAEFTKMMRNLVEQS